MSRRNRSPKCESALAGKVSVRIVCTDRGQHNAVPFGVVVVWPSAAGGWQANSARALTRGPSSSTNEYVDVDDMTGDRLHRTFSFRCRRCPRDVPLGQGRLEQACIAIAEADDTLQLDISLL